MKNRSFSARRLAVLALLAALLAIVAFLPIRIGVVEITLSMIPVAIGASLYGIYGGTLLGTVFGIISFLQCLGYSPFGATLLSISLPLTMLMCIPTRTAAGFIAGLVSALLKKHNHKTASVIAASVLAPICNTVFFTGVMLLSFWNTDYIQGLAAALGTKVPFLFAAAFIGINGLIEIIVGIAVAIPAAKALSYRVK